MNTDPVVEPTQPAGVRALTAKEFSLTDSVGGMRGAVESMLPGLVFVVVYTITRELSPALYSSLAVAVLAVAARLVQRTPITQAFSGLLGVGIGVFWAWKSGDATDYFAYGLWTNGAYLAVLLVTVLIGWPIVGLVVEALRAGFGVSTGAPAKDAPLAAEPADEPAAGPAWSTAWRKDRAVMRRYTIATWLWIAMFALRLAVQVPLYLSSSVGWLGTARLVMGIPLWALVLWATWILVRRPAAPAARPGTHPAL
ncbi:Protein of unknown function [Sanguibacter gelidistatuariae]|uniref:Intracellular septation protein A n=1 Tax=Sanguibacter gelidistatuariae TaxID=1814289 RepID=A0A1G6RJP8_9MICO|nr:DUF3159 domain-containing protein [Sanguibacter gelidistatuariae]SDD04146.1 Protein of unknown function [Sanguibacter gelidistatuariae]